MRAYGDYLPWAFIGPRWFVQDWWSYGLPVAPWGYEWVRVGPDALLVEADTGQVVQVVYGVFYW